MYYIYAYVREDGTPYYVGKGKGKRAWNKNHVTNLPDKDRIVIMESGLTEVGALALERFYIRWYGRKDLGTGILRNMTDGGDGVSGRFQTDETKRKIGDKNKGKTPWCAGKELGPHTEEAKEKMREAKIGYIPWNKGKKGSQIPWNKGKVGIQSHTLEVRERMRTSQSLRRQKENKEKLNAMGQ